MSLPLRLGSLRSLCLVVVTLALWLNAPPSAQAQTTYRWNNNGTDWATGNNWVGGVPPTNSATLDTAYFSAYPGSLTYPNLGSNLAIRGGIFDNSGLDYGLTGSGNTLTIGTGGLLVYSPTDPTNSFTSAIDAHVALGAAQTWNIANPSAAATGTLNLTDSLSGAFILTKAGGGTLALSGSTNSFTGLSIDAGTVTFDYGTNNDNKIASTGAATLNGGRLVVEGNASSATSQSIASLTVSRPSRLVLDANGGQTATLNLGSAALVRSGTGLLEILANNVSAALTTTASTNNDSSTNPIIPWAVISKDGGTTWNFATATGTRIDAQTVSENGAETTWTAVTVNARPLASAALTATRTLNSLILDNGINVSNAQTLNIGANGFGTILQTGGTSTISSATLAYGTNVRPVFFVEGTLNLNTIGFSNDSTNKPGALISGPGTLNYTATAATSFSPSGPLTIDRTTVNISGGGATNPNFTGSTSITVLNGGILSLNPNNGTTPTRWLNAATSVTLQDGTFRRGSTSSGTIRMVVGQSNDNSSTTNVFGNSTIENAASTGTLRYELGAITVNTGATLTLRAASGSWVNSNSTGRNLTLTPGSRLIFSGAGSIGLNTDPDSSSTGSRQLIGQGTSAQDSFWTVDSVSTPTLGFSATLTLGLVVNGSGTGGLAVQGPFAKLFSTTNLLTNDIFGGFNNPSAAQSRIVGLTGTGGTLTIGLTDSNSSANSLNVAPTAVNNAVRLGLAPTSGIITDIGGATDALGNWGGLVVKGPGTTRLQGSTSLIAGTTTTDLFLLGGTFDMNGNNATVEGAGTLEAGTVAVSTGSSILTAASFTKQSSGTVVVNNGATLAAAGTFSHKQGTLTVNGQIGSGGALTIAGTGLTAILNGNGTVGRDILVAAGGILAPGTGTGSLSAAKNTTFASGGAFSVEINGANAGAASNGYDQLIIADAGSITLTNGTLSVAFGYVPTSADKFFIIRNDNASSGSSGAFNSFGQDALVQADVNSSGFSAYISYTGDALTNAIMGGNDTVIYLTPVPEPGAMLVLSTAGLAIGVRLRRRVFPNRFASK